MRRDPSVAFASALLMLLAVCGADAFAHGGVYRGPGGVVPPSTGGPGSGGGGPGGGGGPAGPATGGALVARKAPVADYTDWYTWWQFNREPFLNLRERLGSRFAVTGNDAPQGVRPRFDELEGVVLPALCKLLEEDDPDIVDSAVLALARVTPKEHGALVLDHLTATLGHAENPVQQSAILALGVLGDARGAPVLVDILRDAPAGRAALRLKRECDVVKRGMAAVALGMIGDPATIAALAEVYRSEPNAKLELKASIVSAMGLFDAAPYEAVSFLREVLADRRLNDLITAQAPIALSRLGDAARPVLNDLLLLARSRKTPNPLRQSAVIAIGKIAVPEDREALDVLLQAIEGDNDAGVANFALVAVGEIGGRAALEPERHGAMLQEVDRFVLRQVVRPQRQQVLPFAATAAAMLARGYAPDHAQRAVYATKLLDAFADTRRPEHRAAIAVALGIMEQASAAAPLLVALRDSADRELNGYLAEALGLMRHQPAAALLLERARTETDPAARVKLAVGLGLMGDLDVVALLLDELKQARTLWVTASVAQALGRVGDRSTMKPLLDLAHDRGRPGLARGFGVVAIGLVAEKSAYPWNARLSIGANYLAPYHVQTEILDIL